MDALLLDAPKLRNLRKPIWFNTVKKSRWRETGGPLGGHAASGPPSIHSSCRYATSDHVQTSCAAAETGPLRHLPSSDFLIPCRVRGVLHHLPVQVGCAVFPAYRTALPQSLLHPIDSAMGFGF